MRNTFQEVILSTLGQPIATGTPFYVPPSLLRNVVWWNRGILGIAESFYPHPDNWTIGSSNLPLHKLDVHALTQAISPYNILPTCITAWEARLGELPWKEIGKLYRNSLLTPSDWKTHFKNILHRALYTRSKRNDDTSRLCRCCKSDIERVIHLVTCNKLKPLWNHFTELTHSEPTNTLDTVVWRN